MAATNARLDSWKQGRKQGHTLFLVKLVRPTPEPAATTARRSDGELMSVCPCFVPLAGNPAAGAGRIGRIVVQPRPRNIPPDQTVGMVIDRLRIVSLQPSSLRVPAGTTADPSGLSAQSHSCALDRSGRPPKGAVQCLQYHRPSLQQHRRPTSRATEFP